MDVLRPLRATLFFYEVFRLLMLVCFLFALVPEAGFSAGSSNNGGGAFFPYLVYLSANALFPLMTLFLWLKLEEYRNYLPLYMAGKIIGVVSFYAWEFFSPRELGGTENLVRSMVLLGGSIFISLADILAVWGALTLRNKTSKGSPAGRVQMTRAGGDSRRDSKDSLENGGV